MQNTTNNNKKNALIERLANLESDKLIFMKNPCSVIINTFDENIASLKAQIEAIDDGGKIENSMDLEIEFLEAIEEGELLVDNQESIIVEYKKVIFKRDAKTNEIVKFKSKYFTY